MTIQDIFSALAFALSIYATYKTVGFNRRQNEMADIQAELNKLLLRKETNEAIESFKPELGVSFIKLGTGSYRLKVYNKGKGSAKNLTIDFPEGNEMFSQYDIESKFPLERMDQHQSVEIIAAVHMGSPRKITVHLLWDDDTGIEQSKIFYPTL